MAPTSFVVVLNLPRVLKGGSIQDFFAGEIFLGNFLVYKGAVNTHACFPLLKGDTPLGGNSRACVLKKGGDPTGIWKGTVSTLFSPPRPVCVTLVRNCKVKE